MTSVEEERGLREEGEEDEDSYRTSQVPTSLFDVETMAGKGPESLREVERDSDALGAINLHQPPRKTKSLLA